MNTLDKPVKRRTILKAGLSAALSPLVGPALAAESVQTMLTRAIPSSGQEIGVIAYGGSPAFRGNKANDPALARELIDILINAGGAYIDANRNAPQKLAEFLSPDKLAKLELAISPSAAELSRGMDWINALQTQIHKKPISFLQSRFSGQREDTKNSAAMRALQAQGTVRHIGFSGMNNFDYLESLISDLKPDYLQLNYSLFEPQAAQRLLPIAQDSGVAIVINRPFMNGKYFSRVKDLALPEWASEFDCQSWAQFSLKFIASHPAVNTVLTETTKPRHAKDNVAAGYGRMPDQAQRARMLQFIQSL